MATIPVDGEAGVLRRWVLRIALVVDAGIVVELATTRHWGSAVRLIPWVSCGLLVVAIALVYRDDAPVALAWGRRLAALVTLSSVFGVWEHVESNHDAGALDFRFATSWSSMSAASQWWKAVSGGVGPSPPLVPGALTVVAALVAVAAMGRTPPAETGQARPTSST